MARPIKVSDPVYSYLEDRKDDGEHTSFDSAVREVIRDAGDRVGDADE